MRFQALFSLSLAGMACLGAFSGEISLAVRGQPSPMAIVLPLRPDPAEWFAAEELRDHVEAMCGVRLKIREGGGDTGPAVVLSSGADALDGFSIRTEAGRVEIRGMNPRGTLYGVYDFLERFGGCGWYAPWRTVVPARDRFAVPEGLRIEERPAFSWRQPSWYGVRTNRLFAARCRLNAESPDGAVPQEDPRFGGCPRRFVRELYTSHTYYVLVPPEEHFAAHPEWFSLVGGKRRSSRGQLCVSNPEVVEAAAKRALELAARDPEAKVLGVSQMDWEATCECERCRAILEDEGAAAGPALRFVNAVAERIGRERPDLTVETLVYSFTIDPPRHVRPRENVMLCCCVAGDYREPLERASRPRNARWRRAFETWSDWCDDLMVWDYTPCFRWAFDPFPNTRVFGPNMRYYHGRGVRGIYMDGQPNPGADFGDLKSWVLAKLAWNPFQDENRLVDRFLDGAYGKAAPYVRRILERQYAALDAHPELELWVTLSDAPEVFDGDYLDFALVQWREAEKLVRDDPDTLFAVRMAKYPSVVLGCLRLAMRVRPYGATRHPERRRMTSEDRLLVAEEAEIRREAAARGIVLRHSHSRGRDRHMRELIARMAEAADPASSDRAVVDVSGMEFYLGDFSGGVWNEKPGTVSLVRDPSSVGGRVAVARGEPTDKAVAEFRLAELAFDDVPYRVRVRMRGEAVGDGEMARVGIVDPQTEKPRQLRSLTAAELVGGWVWVDLGTHLLDSRMSVVIRSSDPCLPRTAKALFVDVIEFERKERP